MLIQAVFDNVARPVPSGTYIDLSAWSGDTSANEFRALLIAIASHFGPKQRPRTDAAGGLYSPVGAEPKRDTRPTEMTHRRWDADVQQVLKALARFMGAAKA